MVREARFSGEIKPSFGSLTPDEPFLDFLGGETPDFVGRAKDLQEMRRKRPSKGLKKQLSLFLPIADWKAVREEAARQGIPMTTLVEKWIKPRVRKLRAK